MSTTGLRSSSSTSQEEARGWLRRLLALDAAVTAANGLAYMVASGPLEDLLGVGGGLLLGLGAFLVLFGAMVGYLARKTRPPVPAVQAVIEANVLWAVLSIVTLVRWLDDPSTVGQVWIPLQAVAVAGFAALQYGALRRSRD